MASGPGPVMIDLAGPELSSEERELLRHPAVGGVCLFARNYHSPAQMSALTAAIRGLRSPPPLVAVDHEGGAVQRFRRGFVELPAPAAIGDVWKHAPARAIALAREAGWVMAAELRAVGVDLSFAPVLDLRHPASRVINERAFHRDPDVVSTLGAAYMHGMRQGGMAAVGKHYPGHGSVREDSHHELPVDRRSLADLRLADLVPFERLIAAGLPALMPAHVVYPEVDARPAGFSPRWLRELLREELGFVGAVFSDDLSMAAAASIGPPPARAEAALAAGCDMVLVCNDRAAAVQVLDRLPVAAEPLRQARLMALHGRGRLDWEALHADPAFRAAAARLATLIAEGSLAFGDDELL